MGTATTTQTHFRWRNDNGSLSTATWKVPEDSVWSPSISDLDTPVRLRLAVANTGTKDETAGPYLLYLDVDGGGYQAITPSSTNGVKMVASAYVTDDVLISNRYLTGSQTWTNGRFDSNGAATSITLPQANDTEVEFCIKLDSANLSGGETLSFRVYLSGSPLDGYTNTPAITAPTPPSGNFVQSNYRIREDIDGLNSEGSGWSAALNTAANANVGKNIRIRIEIEETNVGSGTIQYKLKWQKNGAGGYTDLTYEVQPNSAFPAAWITATGNYIDNTQTTNLLSGSSRSFVAGYGKENANPTTAITLNNEHTEIEWNIRIPSIYDGDENVVGDYLEFRVYESDDTPLDSYTNTPRVNITVPVGYIGGTLTERPGRIAVTDSNGKMYLIHEDTTVNQKMFLLASTNGGDSWQKVGGTGPVTSDLEAIDSSFDAANGILHIIQMSQSTVRYHRFFTSDHATSPDTWSIKDEVVVASVTSADQTAGCQHRSDGTVVALYQETVSADERMRYIIRSSGGSWGSAANLDSEASVDFTFARMVMGASQKIHFAYKDNTNGYIYHRSLSSDDTLNARHLVHNDCGIGNSDQASIGGIVYWDESGTEKVMVVVPDESDTFGYSSIITNDGTPSAVTQATDEGVDWNTGFGSLGLAADLVVGDVTGEVFFLYGSATDEDLRLATYSSGSWGTDQDLHNQTTEGVAVTVDIISGWKFKHSAGNGGATVVGYFWENNSNGETGYTQYDEYEITAASSGDNLTANSITTNPVAGTPALGQEHDLTATGIKTDPVVDTPSLGQVHDLTATGITTNPVVDNPTAGHIHDLSANGITANPVVDTPSLGQEHALSSTGITTNPVVDTPDVGQVHVLTANSVITSPVIQKPNIGQTHVLSGTGIKTDPVVDTPDVGQVHALTPTGITTNPVVGNPILGTEGEDNLTANGITTNPVTGTPALAQEHDLNASAISTTPEVDTPSLGQVHTLSATGLTTSPAVGSPDIAQVHSLSASGITTNPVVGTPALDSQGQDDLAADGIITSPVVDNPSVGQTHILTATGITTNPVVDNPSVVEIHNLSPTGITTNPVVGTPSLDSQGEDALTANSITTSPSIGTPSLGQVHALDANDIETTPVVETPTIGQIHTLLVGDIQTTPVVETPIISHIHVLSAVGIEVNPVTETPSIAQAHVLSSTPILVSPVVGNPTMGQVHIITASGITTVPKVGNPEWDLIEGVVVVDFSTIYPETSFSIIQPEISFIIVMED